jgi:hypothetical protein
VIWVCPGCGSLGATPCHVLGSPLAANDDIEPSASAPAVMAETMSLVFTGTSNLFR